MKPEAGLDENMADKTEDEEQCIKDLREKFLNEQAENIDDYDHHDISRLQHDDLWLRCFIRARNHDVSKALEAMIICLRWRKTFGVSELTERQIDRRLFEIGFLYPRNRDKEGNSIILFVGKNYKKDSQQNTELKRFLVFLLEKHARLYPSRKVTMVFDMQETGLANMAITRHTIWGSFYSLGPFLIQDMDFIKFIITCFTNYFPNTLAWLLVVELPWILSAAWKIVKTWLSPEAVNKIKFVNKQELLDYVDEDKVLVKLGGTDSYEYCYPPCKDDTGLGPPERDPDTFENPPMNDVNTTTRDNTSEGREEYHSMKLSFDESDTSPAKKVEFEEKTLTKTAVTSNSTVDSSANHVKPQPLPKKTNPGSIPSSTPIQEQKPVSKLLNITPTDELVFNGAPNSSGEILQVLTLDNSTFVPVAFKVKTTSPEGYRVRPSSGRISPNSFTDVNVFLQPGHTAQVARDKFLVMSTEIKEGTMQSETYTVWKTAPKSSILEHRLRCSIEKDSPVSQSNNIEALDTSSLEAKINALSEQLKSVEKKVDRIDKKVSFVEEGLQLFIKVQLGLFSGMIILFAIVFYYTMFLGS